ncbi:MAG: hypothetical protein J7578_25545 [Chitinophagaceae bacterium]|nr:hypothetical protein [Chitinophagaceae bacterium]
MKKNILFFFILALVATSCQKEVSEEVPTNNPGGPVTADGYQPLTAGTSWKYRQTGMPDYSIIVTSNKKTVGGIQYVELSGDQVGAVTGSSWFGISGNNYYLKSAGTVPSGGSFDLTQLYLNDKEAVGHNWNISGGQANNISAKVPGKIIEKDITLTVQGKTYNNVIHTQTNIIYVMPAPFGEMSTLFYDYYVAKGVGIVKLITSIDEDMTTVISTMELLEYSIK